MRFNQQYLLFAMVLSVAVLLLLRSLGSRSPIEPWLVLAFVVTLVVGACVLMTTALRDPAVVVRPIRITAIRLQVVGINAVVAGLVIGSSTRLKPRTGAWEVDPLGAIVVGAISYCAMLGVELHVSNSRKIS